jgi:hypothetical protein
VRPVTRVAMATGKVTRTKVIDRPPCGCAKQGYTSRKLAKTNAAIASRETGDLIEAYKCREGGHCWHIGHALGSPRNQGRRVA